MILLFFSFARLYEKQAFTRRTQIKGLPKLRDLLGYKTKGSANFRFQKKDKKVY